MSLVLLTSFGLDFEVAGEFFSYALFLFDAGLLQLLAPMAQATQCAYIWLRDFNCWLVLKYIIWEFTLFPIL